MQDKSSIFQKTILLICFVIAVSGLHGQRNTFGDEAPLRPVYRENWTQSQAPGQRPVKIHYIEKGYAGDAQLSLVVSAGLWEPAERSLRLFDAMDFHCVSFSYRGRGKSDTPESGYDQEHHLGDLRAVIKDAGVKKMCLLAFSRGVGHALGYILNNPDKVAGLIIVDQPPVHLKPWNGYADYWKKLVYLGRPLTDFMRPQALDLLEKEARHIVYWDKLNQIKVPVLLMRGVSKTAKIPSNLTDAEARRYLELIPDIKEVRFNHSGHMIADEEPAAYADQVRSFLKRLMKRSD
ncbi:MAG: alpha/beta hydrolase [bacterium]|nr:alpha/beta hydrolase [bacterium]